ncbi:hypothetical protein [Burkholderia gladioli]|uniref:hypothetical protein n=1 Tax=Burkholderia gladioli TaxID=28095 RepID=UPI0016414E74|nr:hypothetical protein [Burkholderia gladioli]
MKNDFACLDTKHLFVPFAAEPVGRAVVVARHPSCEELDSVLLTRYAYAVPSEDTGRGKVFYAERYGGDGISFHGGGARCGYDGRFQLKGIGPNSLLGDKADPHHSDGKLTLKSALSEFTWSQALQEILPFGAVQCLAVISIGLMQAADSADVRHTRALLVRESALRPAHFDRAAYFRPRFDLRGHRREDVARVKEMIALLPELLPRAPDVSTDQWYRLDVRERFERGIHEFIRRAAVQCAAAKSRLLLHNLSLSNVALDGRWLDLASVASLHPGESYGDKNFDIAWNELKWQAAPILRGLLSICFQADKYIFGGKGAMISLCTGAVGRFEREYAHAVCRDLLVFAGIPMIVADKIHRDPLCLEWATRLSAHIDASLASHVVNARYLADIAQASSKPVANLLHYTFAREFGADWVRLGNLGRDIDLALQRLFPKVLALAFASAGEIGIARQPLLFAIAVNAQKYASERVGLDFDSIDADLQAWCDDHAWADVQADGTLQVHVDRLRSRIVERLACDPDTMLTIVAGGGPRHLRYDLTCNCLIEIRGGNVIEFPNFINERNCTDFVFLKTLGCLGLQHEIQE